MTFKELGVNGEVTTPEDEEPDWLIAVSDQIVAR